MDQFYEASFRKQLDSAMLQVKTVLDVNRNPALPSDVPHTYQDKYACVESATNIYLAATVNWLQFLGLTKKQLSKMQAWAARRSVSLRFSAEDTCVFLEKKKRTIEPTSEYVTKMSFAGIKSSFTSKSVTTILEYFWRFERRYRIEVLRGSGSETFTLLKGKQECQLVTTSESSPHPEKKATVLEDVQITWMLQQLTPDLVWQFAIDRKAKTCHTPRRNEEVEAALQLRTKLARWTKEVEDYLRTGFAISNVSTGIMDLTETDLFCPIVPLFEVDAPSGSPSTSSNLTSLPDASETTSAVLPLSDSYAFLEQQLSCMMVKEVNLQKTEPTTGLVRLLEAKIIVAMTDMRFIGTRLRDSLEFIECILRNQLVDAIGKTVGAEEFAEYMRYHMRKLFKEEFYPKPFCHSIRRPECSPDGVLSIEASGASGMAEGINTIVRHSKATHKMSFELNASSSVSLMGDRYVHAYVGHQFSGDSGSSLSLTARARQFSSFVLLVGTITGASTFAAKHAIIIQNKDEVLVSLLLDPIPTAQEFRDAVESLSPEQQGFAKAFRAMQLESTLFAVAVVQIKPALEAVLNLPDDSLTKEIILTEDLLDLFIKYQIPSDMLSFDGDAGLSSKGKVNRVRDHVTSVKAMIDAQRNEEMRQLEMERKAALAQAELEARRKAEELARKRAAELARVRAAELARQKKLESEKLLIICEDSPGRPDKFRKKMKKGKRLKSAAADTLSSSFSESMSQRTTGANLKFHSKEETFRAPSSSASSSIMDTLPSKSTAGEQTVPEFLDVDVRERLPESAVESPEAAECAPEEVAEEEPEVDVVGGQESCNEESSSGHEDYTKLPTLLDAKFLVLDEDSAVRPTIVKPASTWKKKYLPSLLSKQQTLLLSKEILRTEKMKAFDLLDALTKSGGLTLQHASLHVLIVATHCFDKTLLDTVIQDNVNPIDKVERSLLIMASTIFDKPAEELIKPSRVASSKASNPALFSA